MSFAFDTLAQAKRLREAGFDERQAEALTAALCDAAMTVDVSTLATKADLDALRVATKADLDALKAANRADLTAGLAALKADLLQWIIGLFAGAVIFNAVVVIGALFGIAKVMAR